MLHHGNVQSRIQNEVDLVIGRDREPSLGDRAAMPYTEAAILENLRFGCIVPLSIPHTDHEDVTFRGYSIAKGTWVSYAFVSTRLSTI
jgi:cytochrome P450